MDEASSSPISPRQRDQILKGLDRMVAQGRVTQAEAANLRAASDPATFERALRDIRIRHAEAKLADAVQAGHMTQPEADANLERLKAGEHPHDLRVRLRDHARGASD